MHIYTFNLVRNGEIHKLRNREHGEFCFAFKILMKYLIRERPFHPFRNGCRTRVHVDKYRAFVWTYNREITPDAGL